MAGTGPFSGTNTRNLLDNVFVSNIVGGPYKTTITSILKLSLFNPTTIASVTSTTGFLIGNTITITGAAIVGNNGTFPITNIGTNSITYNNSNSVTSVGLNLTAISNGPPAPYTTNVDMINVRNVYVSGDFVRVDDTGKSLGKWVEDIPSIFTLIATPPGYIQATVDIHTLPLSNRYFVTLNPINNSTYTTSKNKSLSTIIHYTPTGDIVGGGTIFIDINNYITISSHPNIVNNVLVTVVTNSPSQEQFSISFRRIYS